MSIRSDRDIARAAAEYDTGVCNPRKIQEGQEAHADAVEELVDRGYSQAEAEQMIREES
ncbi:hypothetical protein KJ819_02525 [Patescibacteria group bacterium]|nr:hypothetical protein [Patescibacteria group bacterium]MBU1500842.1 hypothetical protein [Patescibacteria group bacterium]MBU2080897.1 hypothetical protein [Patescibacteria group bacterium]MBU2124002.1 hypothetical protein [Patescibacteria group bacterium]MBU2194707.1 hypothetical protein [Patescibacteria group bacterium]